jgi:hypothetical protein
MWTVSGVVMVAKSNDEVRGVHLLTEPADMRLAVEPVPPRIAGAAIRSLKLEPRGGGPRWVVVLGDGTTRLADPMSGALLAPMTAADAASEVARRYTGSAAVQSVSRTNPDKPPLELRRSIAAWRVAMDDGTNFYVDAGSGEIVARRTGWWRFYDFMWGLHIMDPGGREDTHNPWVVGFGIAALVMSLLALALLPLTLRRRRRASEQASEQVCEQG